MMIFQDFRLSEDLPVPQWCFNVIKIIPIHRTIDRARGVRAKNGTGSVKQKIETGQVKEKFSKKSQILVLGVFRREGPGSAIWRFWPKMSGIR